MPKAKKKPKSKAEKREAMFRRDDVQEWIMWHMLLVAEHRLGDWARVAPPPVPGYERFAYKIFHAVKDPIWTAQRPELEAGIRERVDFYRRRHMTCSIHCGRLVDGGFMAEMAALGATARKSDRDAASGTWMVKRSGIVPYRLHRDINGKIGYLTVEEGRMYWNGLNPLPGGMYEKRRERIEWDNCFQVLKLSPQEHARELSRIAKLKRDGLIRNGEDDHG